MACYFNVLNCCALAHIFSQSKHCASLACQLNSFVIEKNKDTDTGILTTTGDKAEVE